MVIIPFAHIEFKTKPVITFHLDFVEEVLDPIFMFQITHGLTPPSWNTEEMMKTISTELIPFQYYIDFGTTEKAKLKVGVIFVLKM